MLKALTLLSLGGALAMPALAQEASFSTGRAETINEGLFDCGRGSRASAVGRVTSEDGAEWIVPAQTNFATAPKAADLFNECGGEKLSGLSALDLDAVPVFDVGGDEDFTAYIFADNYFELYVNGQLIAVDPVPFTKFNSNVVRFKADRPVTFAVMVVDWEENLGLGSEGNRGKPFHPGDGGFVAQMRDAAGDVVAITDSTWKAQTFYTAPLSDRACLKIDGTTRDSSTCSTDGRDTADGLSAAHWALPDGWETTEFDASAWPDAVTFTNETVGVDNKKAFANFVEVFDTSGADAQFIWSSNLVLDNLVLLRTQID